MLYVDGNLAQGAVASYGEIGFQLIRTIVQILQRHFGRSAQAAQIRCYPGNPGIGLEQCRSHYGRESGGLPEGQGCRRRRFPDGRLHHMIGALPLDDADLLVRRDIRQHLHRARGPANLQPVYLAARPQTEMRHDFILFDSPAAQQLTHLFQVSGGSAQPGADAAAVACRPHQFHPQPVVLVALVAKQAPDISPEYDAPLPILQFPLPSQKNIEETILVKIHKRHIETGLAVYIGGSGVIGKKPSPSFRKRERGVVIRKSRSPSLSISPMAIPTPAPGRAVSSVVAS